MKRATLFIILLAGMSLAVAFGGGKKEPAGPVQLTPEERVLAAEQDLGEARRQVAQLTTDVQRLSKTPINQEIIRQIQNHSESSTYGQLEYYISIPLTLLRGNMDEEVQPQDGKLTFTETTTSTQVPIKLDDVGKLQSIAVEGFRDGPDSAGLATGTFEIRFHDETVILGFTQNRISNCFDLEYVREDNRIIPLHFSGAKPHLLIRYQAAFEGNTEIQVIVDGVSAAPAAGAGAATNQWETPPANNGSATPAGAGSLTNQWETPPANNGSAAPAGTGAATARRETPPAAERRAALPPGEETIVDVPEYYPPVSQFVAEDPPVVVLPAVPEPVSPADDEARLAALREQLESAPDVQNLGNNPLSRESRPEESYNPDAPLFNTGTGEWIIQVGAFAEHQNAEEAYTVLRNAGFAPDRDSHQGLTRIFIPGVDETELQSIAVIMEILGFETPYIRR
jgi:hypothetical protein